MELSTLLAACPSDYWFSRKRYARIVLENGHTLQIYYNLPWDEEQLPPILTWRDVKTRWGAYLPQIKGIAGWLGLYKREHCQQVAYAFNEAVKQDIHIARAQSGALLSLLSALSTMDKPTITKSGAALRDSLEIHKSDAEAFGWFIWLDAISTFSKQSTDDYF